MGNGKLNKEEATFSTYVRCFIREELCEAFDTHGVWFRW